MDVITVLTGYAPLAKLWGFVFSLKSVVILSFTVITTFLALYLLVLYFAGQSSNKYKRSSIVDFPFLIKSTNERITCMDAFYHSYYWQARKLLFRGKNKYKCRCGRNRRLHLHHLSYRYIGREPDKHLCWLCKICHDKAHSKTH